MILLIFHILPVLHYSDKISGTLFLIPINEFREHILKYMFLKGMLSLS